MRGFLARAGHWVGRLIVSLGYGPAEEVPSAECAEADFDLPSATVDVDRPVAEAIFSTPLAETSVARAVSLPDFDAALAIVTVEIC